MSSVNSTTYLPASGMTASDNGPVRAPKQVLDQADFLKLLTVQLTKQDPLKPMEDQAFIAQMAQFSSLEQMNALTSEFAILRADQQMTTAGSLIGREVTVDDGEQLITGIVEAVDNGSEEGVAVVVGGVAYQLDSVLRVAPPANNSETDNS
jgi:flagellar basal-body rod modification protein FlgD